ncbi:hypothetical protein ACOMHN_047524 [Nucella lapillus]
MVNVGINGKGWNRSRRKLIITTLRRGFSEADDGTDSSQPYHIPVPAETYFLTPDPTLHNFSFSGGKHSGSSRTYSSSQSVSSFGESTVTTSAPASSRKCLQLPPEVVEAKRKHQRRRTAAYICLGVLSLALVALAVGVILHFLLETGSIGGQGDKGSISGKE